MKVLSPQGMKGGVGKSVNAVNLAGFLASKKEPTLFIDGDYQANSSLFFGAKKHAILNKASLYEILMGQKSFSDVIRPTDFPFLDIVPASNELSRFNQKEQDRYTLRAAIRRAKLDKKYKWVVIDSRPELSNLFRNIAVASNGVFLPVFADCDAIDGLSLILNELRDLSEAKRQTTDGDDIALLGCVINNIDRKFRTEQALLPIIKSALTEKNIPILAEVPRSAGISTSKDSGRPIAFIPKLRNIPVGTALEEMAESILKASSPKKGRPHAIPVFTERETHRLTDQLYSVEESLAGMSGELTL